MAQTDWLGARDRRDALFGVSGLSLQADVVASARSSGCASTSRTRIARTVRWLHVADYVAYRLCGVGATDHSLASRTLAYDIRARRLGARRSSTRSVSRATLGAAGRERHGARPGDGGSRRRDRAAHREPRRRRRPRSRRRRDGGRRGPARATPQLARHGRGAASRRSTADHDPADGRRGLHPGRSRRRPGSATPRRASHRRRGDRLGARRPRRRARDAARRSRAGAARQPRRPASSRTCGWPPRRPRTPRPRRLGRSDAPTRRAAPSTAPSSKGWPSVAGHASNGCSTRRRPGCRPTSSPSAAAPATTC